MGKYEDILKKKAKEWDCPDLMNREKRVLPKIPFSSPLLNYATYGGVPRGRVIEFHGAPGGGKSTTAIDVCYQAVLLFRREFEEKVQSMRDEIAAGKKQLEGPLEDLLEQGPKKVLYVDLEHTFDWSWAEKMGLSTNDIDVMEPPNIAAETILNTVQSLFETGQVGLSVLDSVPSLVTKAQLEKEYGERTVASLAGLMTSFMTKIVPVCARYDCTLILINQIRDNMDNPYVVNTPGGQAIKFYSTLRMLFRLGAPIDFAGNELAQSAENPAGYLVNVKLVKQKGAAFDRKMASYYLMADSGIRPDFDFAKLAINKYGIIKKGGAWFTFCDPMTGEILEEDGKAVKVNGQVKVFEYLQNHPEYYNRLQKYILADINGEDLDLSDEVPEMIESFEDDPEGELFTPDQGVEGVEVNG